MSTIPEDIITNNILPRLPFRSLCRFTLVRQSWNRLISGDDPLFAKLHPSCFIIGPTAYNIFLNNQVGIQILPTFVEECSDIPAPIPKNTFIDNADQFAIPKTMASTSGLLCLQCVHKRGSSLYIYNPATRESGHLIPVPSTFSSCDTIGLAVSLMASSEQHCSYMLVHLYPRKINEAIEFRFNVFSSQHRSQGWTESNKVMVVPQQSRWSVIKSVFAGGCLYWYEAVGGHLVWFCCHDKEIPATGLMQLPPRLECFEDLEIGVCADMVTLARVSVEGFDVWMLYDDATGTKRWEHMYRVSHESMMKSNAHVVPHLPPWNELLWSTKTISYRMRRRFRIVPLPYEGGSRVLFRLRVFGDPDILLSFDLKSRSMFEVVTGDDLFGFCGTFGYIKSMTPLPELD